MTLEPLIDYSKFKADCEKVLLDNETSEFNSYNKACNSMRLFTKAKIRFSSEYFN